MKTTTKMFNAILEVEHQFVEGLITDDESVAAVAALVNDARDALVLHYTEAIDGSKEALKNLGVPN